MGCILSLGFLVIFEVYEPNLQTSTRLLTLACNTQLFFVFFTGLLIEADQMALAHGLDTILVIGFSLCCFIAISSVLLPELKYISGLLVSFFKPYVLYCHSKLPAAKVPALKLFSSKPKSKQVVPNPPPRRLPPLLNEQGTPQHVWDRINDASMKMDLSRISALCEETNSASKALANSLAILPSSNIKSDEQRKVSPLQPILPGPQVPGPQVPGPQVPGPQLKLRKKSKNRIAPSGPPVTVSMNNGVQAAPAQPTQRAEAENLQKQFEDVADPQAQTEQEKVELQAQVTQVPNAGELASEAHAPKPTTAPQTKIIEVRTKDPRGEAALKLQCAIRCHQAKSLLWRQRFQHPTAWSPSSARNVQQRTEQTKAALTLQAWWRMILVRLWMAYWRFCRETVAAVKLQSWIRMVVAMKQLAVQKQRRASVPLEL